MPSTMPDATHDPTELRARARANAQKRIIVVLGPTAGGKSDLAMELARRYGGELLSADSMQVYRGMNIGTAKPTRAEQAEIPHHGIDLIEASAEGFTVASWLEIAERALLDIQSRQRVPIVVGGTNLYIRAFLEGLDEAPAADTVFRAQLEAVASTELHERLCASDPAAAARLHPNDRRRVIRALEIAHTTGDSASARRTAWDDAGVVPRHDNLFTVTLDWPVELINRRINARVRRMFDEGFVEEVAALLGHGGLSVQARAACGYEELIGALTAFDGSLRPPHAADLELAAERTKIRSRRLAKQQRTWLKRFRGLQPSVSLPCSQESTAASLADACDAAIAQL